MKCIINFNGFYLLGKPAEILKFLKYNSSRYSTVKEMLKAKLH